MRLRSTVIVLLLMPGVCTGQEAGTGVEQPTTHTIRLAAGTPRPTATLEAVRWLAGGSWRGDGLGGQTEESWRGPAVGAMMGMFRVVHRNEAGDETLGFYEFMTIVETEGSLELRVKHFNADFTGWEQPDRFVTFRLARVTADAVYFDGLTFQREGPDRMTIYLAMRTQGVLREEVFRMTRGA